MARRITGYCAGLTFSRKIRPNYCFCTPIALDSRIARCRHRQGAPQEPDSPAWERFCGPGPGAKFACVCGLANGPDRLQGAVISPYQWMVRTLIGRETGHQGNKGLTRMGLSKDAR